MTEADSGRPGDHDGLLDGVARAVLGLSILLFVAVGLALLFERRALANALTMDAFTVLSVGLVLRLLAFGVADRSAVLAPLAGRLGPFGRRVRSEGSRIADRLPIANLIEVPTDDRSLSVVRRGVGLAIPLTLGGAGVVVLWDVLDSGRALSLAGFGWLLVGLVGMCVVYAVLRSVESELE